MGLVKEDDAMDGCLLALFFSVFFRSVFSVSIRRQKSFQGLLVLHTISSIPRCTHAVYITTNDNKEGSVVCAAKRRIFFLELKVWWWIFLFAIFCLIKEIVNNFLSWKLNNHSFSPSHKRSNISEMFIFLLEGSKK